MFKKCLICGKVLYILKGNDKVVCCGKEMITLKPNSEDASFEKHVPEYVIKNNKIYVKVNHVMETDHYIEWVMIMNDKEMHMKKFNPGDKCECEFDYLDNAIIYSYCNKHNLWNKICKM